MSGRKHPLKSYFMEQKKFKIPCCVLGQTLRAVLVSTTGFAGVIGLTRPALADNCTDLANARLSNGAITAAQSMPAGNYTAADGGVYSALPAFCRIAATLKPTPESDIKVELWLPSAPGAWNGRFVGTGNGGYAGAISYSALAAVLPFGSAVINTDMGSSPANVLDGRPLIGARQKQIDFGYRATHLMTLEGKRITEAFYARKPRYSYFTGCSTGGGQALHEAEQFPNDYDGIVGGAPAENRTNLHIEILWQYAVTHATAQSLIPESLLQTVTASVLAACGISSGSLPTDAFLTDPRNCQWNARQLLCKPNETANCLNPDQVNALDLIYDGPRDPRTGALIYPGPNRGSESGSYFDIAAQEGITIGQGEPTFDGLFYWVFGPNWDWRTFDYDLDAKKLDRVLGPIENANNANLSAFEQHGGKFLMYHGWADALVPPQNSINYFIRLASARRERISDDDSLARALAFHGLFMASGAWAHRERTDDDDNGLARTLAFYRLFMAPGMGHCGGGPGPNVFGGASNGGGPADPAHNVLLALQQWVEQGKAPDRIVATGYSYDGSGRPSAITRPLCVFPKAPLYSGSGNTNDATSFNCVENTSSRNPMSVFEYYQ